MLHCMGWCRGDGSWQRHTMICWSKMWHYFVLLKPQRRWRVKKGNCNIDAWGIKIHVKFLKLLSIMNDHDTGWELCIKTEKLEYKRFNVSWNWFCEWKSQYAYSISMVHSSLFFLCRLSSLKMMYQCLRENLESWWLETALENQQEMPLFFLKQKSMVVLH